MNWYGFFQELRRRHVFRVSVAYLISAWLLLQLGAILFPAFGAPHWTIRILFGILALGFVATLILAWAFEFTPEGVRRTEEADSEKARSPETHRRVGHVLNAAIMISLLAAVGVLAWRLYLQPTNTTANRAITTIPSNSIAVLPLLDLSRKHNQSYFANGVAEQLIDILSQATNLKVVARTSAFQFKGKAEDVRKIGKILNVRHVLEGSVQRDGDRVRISVQLVNTRTGYHEWSHTYQRKMHDIFAVQDEITHAISSALEAKLVSPAAVAKADPPANPAAYDEYLLGRHLMFERTEKSLRQALVHFRKATNLDPDYAPPYAQAAIVYTLLTLGGGGGTYTWDEAQKLAKPYLDKAIALAPDSPDTQAAHGRYVWTGPTGNARALPYFNRAVKSNPSYMSAVVWKALALNGMGRHEQAFETLRKGAARDPLNWLVNQDLVGFLIDKRLYGEAETIARRFLTVNPVHGWMMMAMIDEARGNYTGVTSDLLNVLEKRPGSFRARKFLANIFGEAGLFKSLESVAPGLYGGLPFSWAHERTMALRASRTFLSRYPQEPAAYRLTARMYLVLGDRDKAKEQFDTALQIADGKGENLWSCQCWEDGAAYVALLQDSGNAAQAKALIGQLRRGIKKQQASGNAPPGLYSFSMAQLDAVSGKREAALKGLEKAVKQTNKGLVSLHGELNPISLRVMPQYDPLRGDPRFQAILKQLDERQARIQAQVLSVLCKRHYPPDGWHPPASTCAGFNRASPSGTSS